MFASISKLVDKAFVVGFIIPLLLGAISILALIRDLDPFREVYQSIIGLKDFTDLTIVVLSLWAAAIVLLLLNHLLFRFLEGYFGPFSWAERGQQMRLRYSEDRSHLKALREAIPAEAAAGTSQQEIAYNTAVRLFCQKWPPERSSVLPTRFGNVIRAFERYPDILYGIDGIPGWLRLQGVVGKDFETLVEDAHAQVSFFVNLWFLSLAFVAVAVGRYLLRCFEYLPDHPAKLVAARGFLFAAVAGLMVARLAYEGAVERAQAWGDLIRAAFDLYLPDLAKKMGYALPPDRDKRRAFWRDATSSFLYNEPIPEGWPFAVDTPAVADAVKKKDASDDEDNNDEEGDVGGTVLTPLVP
jgi:hypothetical protein